MPMHDWTKVPDGTFGALQHHWLCNLSEELNRKLPGEYFSLIERLPDLVMPHRENFGRVEYTDPTEMTDLRGLVTVRSSYDHRLVAVTKVMTPWNAASQETMNVVAKKNQTIAE